MAIILFGFLQLQETAKWSTNNGCLLFRLQNIPVGLVVFVMHNDYYIYIYPFRAHMVIWSLMCGYIYIYIYMSKPYIYMVSNTHVTYLRSLLLSRRGHPKESFLWPSPSRNIRAGILWAGSHGKHCWCPRHTRCASRAGGTVFGCFGGICWGWYSTRLCEDY